MHGVSHAFVFKCIWQVVDAIHSVNDLNIVFPATHEDQFKVADGFKKKSDAGFNSCVGTIDGMLIWTLKPSKAQCTKASCFSKKFFCGRKMKFGLNMQATCDSERRFLDVSIRHPGSTSDFLAFQTSSLKHTLEEPGFLHPDLHLFGDNAYVNTPYMVTPFKNIRHTANNENIRQQEIQKDSFNYYHSQIRINIECAFGMLCHRFGLLRKPFPLNISIAKTTAIVLALCKLHNFIINKGEPIVPKTYSQDAADISMDGGIPLVVIANNLNEDVLATQLVGGGDHMDDYDRFVFRRRNPREQNYALPQERLYNLVIDKDLQRPNPV
jgi:DDE superfamily endonuclease